MEITVKSAKGRMKLLFIEYKLLLWTNGLPWVMDKVPNTAVRHVLSARSRNQLRTCLEQDISFSHNNLKANFAGFMKYTFEVNEAFAMIYSSPLKSRKSDGDVEKTKNNNADSSGLGVSSSNGGTQKDFKAGKKSKKPPPAPCPLPKCKVKNNLHCLSECKDHMDEKKRQYREEQAANKARDGASKDTRSQTSTATSKSVKLVQQPANDLTDDRNTLSCRKTVQDVRTSLHVVGRCGDHSKETIASKKLSKKGVRNGIRKLEAIETFHLKVAPTKKFKTA